MFNRNGIVGWCSWINGILFDNLAGLVRQVGSINISASGTCPRSGPDNTCTYTNTQRRVLTGKTVTRGAHSPREKINTTKARHEIGFYYNMSLPCFKNGLHSPFRCLFIFRLVWERVRRLCEEFFTNTPLCLTWMANKAPN